jgi:hypothetical protein
LKQNCEVSDITLGIEFIAINKLLSFVPFKKCIYSMFLEMQEIGIF